MLLFLCLVCILKWLNVQPQLAAMRRGPMTSDTAIDLIAIEKREKYALVAIKASLMSSIIFLVAHFVLIATQ
jgi:hypothetical protein